MDTDVRIEELRFPSSGGSCAATLYRPGRDTVGGLPCVVMANGFSQTRRDGFPRFARRFARTGMAALTFDFRHYGDSDGQPRQLLDRRRQRDDLTAAIDHARGLEGIDPERVAAWGFSFGGGLALDVASRDDRIAAAVAAFPFLDGLAFMRERDLGYHRRFTGAVLRAMLHAGPVRMPATGPPVSLAALTQPEALPGFEAVRAPDSTWRNESLGRLSQPIVFVRPVSRARQVQCPLLLTLGTEDTIVPSKPIERAASRAPRATLKRYPISHFAAFLDHFDTVVEDQVTFLTDHLAPSLRG